MGDDPDSDAEETLELTQPAPHADREEGSSESEAEEAERLCMLVRWEARGTRDMPVVLRLDEPGVAYRIGRHASAHLRTPREFLSVSRNHAEIRLTRASLGAPLVQLKHTAASSKTFVDGAEAPRGEWVVVRKKFYFHVNATEAPTGASTGSLRLTYHLEQEATRSPPNSKVSAAVAPHTPTTRNHAPSKPPGAGPPSQVLPKRRRLEFGPRPGAAEDTSPRSPPEHATSRTMRLRHDEPDGPIQRRTSSFDEQYRALVRRILQHGHRKEANKGWYIEKADGEVIECDLSDGTLPVTTLRKITTKHCLTEALWYLRGEEHIRFLRKHKCPFWDSQAVAWPKTREEAAADSPPNSKGKLRARRPRPGWCTDSDKDEPPTAGSKPAETARCWVGSTYGLMVDFGGVNQIEQNVLRPLEDRSKASRNMNVTITPADPKAVCVQNTCTTGFQFILNEGTRLDLHVTQRSSDVGIGLPHDIVVWSIIVTLVCAEASRRAPAGAAPLTPGKLFFKFNSAHIYESHKEQLREVVAREPKRSRTVLRSRLDASAPLFTDDPERESAAKVCLWEPGDFEIDDSAHETHPRVKFEQSV